MTTQREVAFRLLRTMLLIRAFERKLMSCENHGFQLLSTGQEAVAAGVCTALTSEDQLLCSGRSIGPALARGLDPGMVMAELLGRTTGPNRGKAGRGHLSLPSAGFFGAHAVVGGNLSIAAGVALALKTQAKPGVAVCIFGDGACGSGALHETMNIASIWKLPLVLVCDNNRIAVSTPKDATLAPMHLSELAIPFNLPSTSVDGMDALAVMTAVGSFVDRARSGQGASFLECNSERFASHSSATRETRSKETMDSIKSRCPISRLQHNLMDCGALDERSWDCLVTEAGIEAETALQFALSSPSPNIDEALSDVY